MQEISNSLKVLVYFPTCFSGIKELKKEIREYLYFCLFQLTVWSQNKCYC